MDLRDKYGFGRCAPRFVLPSRSPCLGREWNETCPTTFRVPAPRIDGARSVLAARRRAVHPVSRQLRQRISSAERTSTDVPRFWPDSRAHTTQAHCTVPGPGTYEPEYESHLSRPLSAATTCATEKSVAARPQSSCKERVHAYKAPWKSTFLFSHLLKDVPSSFNMAGDSVVARDQYMRENITGSGLSMHCSLQELRERSYRPVCYARTGSMLPSSFNERIRREILRARGVQQQS